MKEVHDARRLAESLVETGKLMGKKVVALITNMDQPLGRAVGNAVEVVESVDVLKNRGPEDVRELSIRLGIEMLLIGGVTESEEEARERLESAIRTGRAYEKWREMVLAHGGDPDAVEREDFIKVRGRVQVRAEKGGYLYSFDTFRVGMAATVLGAGRTRKEDRIDPHVGVMVLKKTGDRVEKGEPLFEVLYNDESRLKDALEYLKGSYTIMDEVPPVEDLVIDKVS